MKYDLEKALKKAVQSEVSSADFSPEDQEKSLEQIHKQICGRSNIMKIHKSKRMIILAAALVAAGTITAIGAGKVASLSSSTNRKDAITSHTELVKKAEQHLGTKAEIMDTFSNGLKLTEGYTHQVNAADDAGNPVGSYPEVSAYYGSQADVSLDIGKPGTLVGDNAASENTRTEEYQSFQLSIEEMPYLFLPPDAVPSEEDAKLQEEGKLMISYGTDQEERSTFKSVAWKNGELQYLLLTRSEITTEELVEMAKEVIDLR